MDDSKLEGTGEGVFKTLLSFINLFDYENLDPDTRSSLVNSVSIVVTKADSAKLDEGVNNTFHAIIKNCRKAKYRC